MPDEVIQSMDFGEFAAPLQEISEFLDYVTLNKITKKLTDYSGMMTSGKLSGIVNYSFRMNSIQTEKIVNLLVATQCISRIYNLALKGSRDLEPEYISNIFSDTANLETLTAYVSLRNILENRLSQQTQQYNMNMGKTNTTLAMPINELRGHAKTFYDLTENKLSVSAKAQHGMIAASLHDAYVTILNRQDFKNDRSYMKFFFNDDGDHRPDFVLRKGKRFSLLEIQGRANRIVDSMTDATYNRARSKQKDDSRHESQFSATGDMQELSDSREDSFVDRMLQTPFGRQYGSRIDVIITKIFDPSFIEAAQDRSVDEMREIFTDLFERFNHSRLPDTSPAEIFDAVSYLLVQNYGLKTFSERFLHRGRKESFTRFYTTEMKELIDQFCLSLFMIFFEHQFNDVFRIIKSVEMKKFACAYVMKRIYLKQGENLTNFGYFLVRAIARAGNIKQQ